MRNSQYDFLRAIAILSVLIIHSAGRYSDNFEICSFEHWLSIIIRPCIPIFLFLSGILFQLNKLNFKYLKSKYKRVLIPYFMFSMIALLYQQKYNFFQYIINNPFTVIYRLLFCETLSIYYFIFVIIFLYTIGFILFNKNKSQKYITLVTIFFFVIHIFYGAYYSDIVKDFNFKDNIFLYLYNQRFVFYWPFYFFLGISLQQINLSNFLSENKIYIRFLWFTIFLMYQFIYFKQIGNVSGSNSIIATLYSLSTIAILFTFSLKNIFITFLSKISYMLYLSHIFFVYFLKDFEKYYNYNFPAWFSIISFLLSLFGPIIIYYFYKKIFRTKALFIIGI